MGLVASLCLTPVHAYYSNYSLAFREEHGLLGMRGISQRDCSAFGTDEGSFCGDIVSARASIRLGDDAGHDTDENLCAQCPCTNTSYPHCVAGKCSATPPNEAVYCSATNPCPTGQDCGWDSPAKNASECIMTCYGCPFA
jgi:hypothetical protein